jgi:hypothetical protein
MRGKTITSGFCAARPPAPAAIVRVSADQPPAVAAEPSLLGRFRVDIKRSAELSRKTAKALLRLGGVAMLFAVSDSSLAQVSEVDSYERAVISQTKEDALAFIQEFRSSHLTGDLIESLRPEVAREVCADLPAAFQEHVTLAGSCGKCPWQKRRLVPAMLPPVRRNRLRLQHRRNRSRHNRLAEWGQLLPPVPGR